MHSEDIIEEDLEDLGKYDKLVLAILRFSSAKSTRIHKLGLIINAIIEGNVPESHGAYYYGGFSEDIDASLTQLMEDGLVMKTNDEFTLTTYGKKVLSLLEKREDREMEEIIEIASDVVESFSELDDRELLKLTYQLFPELTDKSLIKDKIIKQRIKDISIYSFHKKDLAKFIEKYAKILQQ